MFRLEDVEHAKFRALAQIQLDAEKGIEAFEEYVKVAFPGHTSRKREEAEEARKALQQWVGTGPLKVSPLQRPTARSRLKQRVVARMAAQEDSELYNKVSSGWQQKSR